MCLRKKVKNEVNVVYDSSEFVIGKDYMFENKKLHCYSLTIQDNDYPYIFTFLYSYNNKEWPIVIEHKFMYFYLSDFETYINRRIKEIENADPE